MSENERPECCTEEMLDYLDDLREDGFTNMFGAAPYLQVAFPELTSVQARKVLVYWMATFDERHLLEVNNG